MEDHEEEEARGKRRGEEEQWEGNVQVEGEKEEGTSHSPSLGNESN